MVAGREALLTILAKVMEEELPVHQFVLELILVLSLYHSLCNLSRIRFYRTYNQGDNVSFSENLNKVYGAIGNAFDSSFKVLVFVHIRIL
jgi:hypothetical protein